MPSLFKTRGMTHGMVVVVVALEIDAWTIC